MPSAAAESDAPFHGGRTTFLLFGHLTKRKGLLILLDALAALRPEAASRIAVVLAGGVEPLLPAARERFAGGLGPRSTRSDRHP